MLFHPEDMIGIVEKTQTKAETIVKNISAIMKKEEIRWIFKAFHGSFPDFDIDTQNQLKFNFKKMISQQGNINAFSVMNSAVGAHVTTAIFDDFVTIDDKVSKATRVKTILFMEEFINNVVSRGGLSRFVGTPWHKLDAWNKEYKLCPAPLLFDCYSTGIMSQDEILKKKSKMTNAAFAANYELRLVASDDVVFKDPRYERWIPSIRTGIGHVDKKYSGTDTNALSFVAKKPNGRYQVYGKIWHENIKEIWSEIYVLWKKYNIGTIYSESNDDKEFASDKLRDMGIPVDPYHEGTNKHVKILNHLKENCFFDLIDFDPETDPEYMSQILDYVEGGEPDDAPDSLASLGRILISSNEFDIMYGRDKK